MTEHEENEKMLYDPKNNMMVSVSLLDELFLEDTELFDITLKECEDCEFADECEILQYAKDLLASQD